jgi:hypothetical protein
MPSPFRIVLMIVLATAFFFLSALIIMLTYNVVTPRLIDGSGVYSPAYTQAAFTKMDYVTSMALTILLAMVFGAAPAVSQAGSTLSIMGLVGKEEQHTH